jgi:hypothetical protein
MLVVASCARAGTASAQARMIEEVRFMGLVIRLPLGFIKQKINDFSVRKQEPTARPEDGIHPA